MKKTMMVLLLIIPLKLLAPTSNCLSIPATEPINRYEELWLAICKYESNHNPLAVNITEQAYGIAQIRQVRVEHYNRLTGKNYTLQDCFNVDVSKEIFMYFTSFYKSEEMIAKRWNGSGPKTLIYWQNIQQIMQSWQGNI